MLTERKRSVIVHPRGSSHTASARQVSTAAGRLFVDPTATEPAVYVESRLPATLRGGLAEKGFAIETLGEWEDLMGHAQFIYVEPSGAFVGGCDPDRRSRRSLVAMNAAATI
jgi:hypothetical protein